MRWPSNIHNSRLARKKFSSSRSYGSRGSGWRIPEPKASEITFIEEGDHDTMQLLSQANLPVFTRRLRLAHHRALDVRPDLGEEEVGRERFAHLAVLVPPQDKLVWLVLPGDPVLIEEQCESPFNRMGKGW